jgi:3-deoxy-7-phosphoheptulonate synthase
MTQSENSVPVAHNRFNTDDLKITGIQEVIAPVQALEEFPITSAAAETVLSARRDIQKVLAGEDDRLLVIIGPCSIHDPKAAVDYGKKLLALKKHYEKDLLIVMRVYFEKPRTTVGWKGLINDPDLDESFNINKGLRLARSLLRDLNELGMPAATEYLDVISPQYVSDLISWGAIGARTTESQVHRELASGLSCPVGFKNATDGGVQVAIDAINAAGRAHHFLSLTKAGRSAIFSTTGNKDCHVILRGGNDRPNYDPISVQHVADALEKAGLPDRIMIDFSHANSLKQYHRQLQVGEEVGQQIGEGDRRIFGVMVESHLVAGSQKLVKGQDLAYGQSVTDACLGWDDSELLLERLAEKVRQRRNVPA